MSLVQFFVGIDVSGRWFDVCEMGGPQERLARFKNDGKGFESFLEFLSSKDCHVCLEVTGGYERKLCLHLAGAGIWVSRANPLLVRRFAEGLGLIHKTDRLDARVLAEYAQMRRPDPMPLEQASRTELRQLVRAMDDHKAQLRQVKNRLRSPSVCDSAIPSLQIVEKALKEAKKLIAKQIDRLIQADPSLAEDVALLDSIPGIAKTSALKILSHLPEGPLRSARALASYAGVVPTQRESGVSVRKCSTIANRCNRSLRAALFMNGMVARRHCPYLKAFALKLVAKGKTKKQAIVAVMRKLTHAIFAVLTRREFYNGEKLCQQT